MIRPMVRLVRARVRRPAALARTGGTALPLQATNDVLLPALASYAAFPPPSNALSCRHFSSFKDLGINEKLVTALDEMGIPSPTGIQEKSMKAILAGKGMDLKVSCGLVTMSNRLLLV